MSLEATMKRLFPAARPQAEFVRRTVELLAPLGFTPENTIAIIDVCRDEMAQSILPHVRSVWGEAFNLSSLAGLFLAGRTALRAALHHAPREGGRERFVLFQMAHIGVDASGRLGACKRRGIEESDACGALNVLLRELEAHVLTLGLDDTDVERSWLTLRVLREMPYGHIPDILELTKLVERIGREDLERTLAQFVHPDRHDYALFSGTQVHVPSEHYIVPAVSYAVVSGKRQDLA